MTPVTMSEAAAYNPTAELPAVVRVHPDDNVAVAMRDLQPGQRVVVDDREVVVAGAVAHGHKIALENLESGGSLRKFGWPIGRATAPIAEGEHVHSHNLETLLSGVEGYHFEPQRPPTLPSPDGLQFEGFRRADGRVGTRNELWVIPTVGCVARTAERIAAIAGARHSKTVDGIHAFTHPFGCSQLGEDLAGTRSILASLACHPNAGGVLLIGLGCESNQLNALAHQIPESLRGRVRTLEAQAEDDETETGLALVGALATTAGLARREPVPISELVIGLKCGGSDGLSGLTANPLVGRLCERIVSAGGGALLTEIPEMFGAERLLMSRARDRRVFEATVDLVNDFKRYFLTNGQQVSENPSPGNIAGGITTLEEKSLGAVQKAGRVPVNDVLRYAERVRRNGLSLVEAPGNDAVSSTALAAAGANIILFTTGRGTPLGFPVPTVKIASNSALAERKRNWIDFDAGQVLTDGLDAVADRLLDDVVRIASGRATAAERNGEREIAIWKRGVTL